MKAWKVRVEVKPWPEGGYVAEAPCLQGCWVVAPTVEQAFKDILEGIEMSIASRLKRGEPLPAELQELSTPDGEAIQVDIAVVA